MSLYRVIVPVTDIEQAARFYSEVLGEPGRRVSGGRHYFGADKAGGAILACYSPKEDGDARRYGVEWRPHPLQYVYFSVDDLEAARQRCISAGARDITDIGKMLWGETMFYAVDPFGNPILTESLTAPLSWAQRLKRVFDIDITPCPLCGGQLRVIEDVTDPDLIRKILNHVQQRAPPRRPEACAQPHQTLPDLFAGR